MLFAVECLTASGNKLFWQQVLLYLLPGEQQDEQAVAGVGILLLPPFYGTAGVPSFSFLGQPVHHAEPFICMSWLLSSCIISSDVQ